MDEQEGHTETSCKGARCKEHGNRKLEVPISGIQNERRGEDTIVGRFAFSWVGVNNMRDVLEPPDRRIQ